MMVWYTLSLKINRKMTIVYILNARLICTQSWSWTFSEYKL